MLDINLEAYSSRSLKNPDALHAYIAEWVQETGDGTELRYLFLDEIQEVESWEKVVPGLQVEFNVDVYLTGSNAYFLSSEFATYLSGRYVRSDFPKYVVSMDKIDRSRNGIVHKDIRAFLLEADGLLR